MQLRPEEAIHRADGLSYERGVAYAAEGRVRIEERTRSRVRATVVGSEPYSVVLDGDDWSCDCPVGMDGTCCKHCVAAALTVLDEVTADGADGGLPDPVAGLRAYAETLDRAALVDLVLRAAEISATFAAQVLADQALVTGDVGAIRREIRALLPSRRYLNWRASNEYARNAREVIPLLEMIVDRGDASKAIPLIEDAFGRLNRLLADADDSDGAIGDLARELLGLHLRACRAGKPDRRRLAAWLIKVGIDDDSGFFQPLVDDYADALGRQGLAAYRATVESRWAGGDREFGVRYARERLARHDRAVETLVEIFTTGPYGQDLYGLAATLFEIGLPDEGLAWAERCIAEGEPVQHRNPYDLAVDEHLRRGNHDEAVRLRRENLQRVPNATTYAALRRTAEEVQRWTGERPTARQVLGQRSVGELVTALLADGDEDEAWSAAQGQPLPAYTWRALADVRQRSHPADAIPIIEDEIREMLQRADRRTYQAAASRLVFLRSVCGRVDPGRFQSFVAGLRETYRRRRTFLLELDRARLP